MNHRLNRQTHKQVTVETGSFRRLVEGTLPVEKYVERLDERVRERERDEQTPLNDSPVEGSDKG